jgi:hypothetical protein
MRISPNSNLDVAMAHLKFSPLDPDEAGIIYYDFHFDQTAQAFVVDNGPVGGRVGRAMTLAELFVSIKYLIWLRWAERPGSDLGWSDYTYRNVVNIPASRW